MDLSFTGEELAFRNEVRAFIEANIPGDTRRKVLEGLDISREAVEKLLEVDPQCWLDQLPQIHEHYARFGDRLPKELRNQLQELERELSSTS